MLDNVCLTNHAKDPLGNTCIFDFEFLAITHQFKFEYQGVFGISPTNLTNEGPSYLQALKRAGKIDEAIISFSLGHKSDLYKEEFASYVIFGGIDDSAYIGDLYRFYLATPYYWAPQIDGIAYDNKLFDSIDKASKFNNDNIAIFDTGAAYIHIPTKYYDILVDHWKRDVGLSSSEFFVGKSGLYEAKVQTCDDLYNRTGNFTVIFGDNTFVLQPRAYLIDCVDIPDKAFCSSELNCLFGISNFSAADTEYVFNENVFLLGDLFLKNFYTVFAAEEGEEASVLLGLSKQYTDRAYIGSI